jgi:hypothetical protein
VLVSFLQGTASRTLKHFLLWRVLSRRSVVSSFCVIAVLAFCLYSTFIPWGKVKFAQRLLYAAGTALFHYLSGLVW